MCHKLLSSLLLMTSVSCIINNICFVKIIYNFTVMNLVTNFFLLKQCSDPVLEDTSGRESAFSSYFLF